MYFEGIDTLASRGYRQYEISNFAREGYESRHNLKYWNCEEYLGFGPAAHSDFGGRRFGNSEALAAYIEGRTVLSESETPSHFARANEYVMLRLRLTEGIDERIFEDRFGMAFEDCFGKRLSKFLRGGFAVREGSRWYLTAEGMYVSNAILSEVLDFSERG